jgi:acyl carrier protein
MERAAVLEGVTDRIAGVLGVPSDSLSEATDLVADCAVDSLDVMEIGTRLEKTFDIRFSLHDLVGTRRIGDVVELVVQHLGSGA